MSAQPQPELEPSFVVRPFAWARPLNIESPRPGRGVSINRVVAAVAHAYGVTPEDLYLKPKRRQHGMIEARSVLAYLLDELAGSSLHQSGRILHLDHSSVMAAVRRIKASADERVTTIVRTLREDLAR